MLLEVYVVSIKNELTFFARSVANINKPPPIKSNFDEERVNVNAFLTAPKGKRKETPPHASHEAGITDMPTVGKNTNKKNTTEQSLNEYREQSCHEFLQTEFQNKVKSQTPTEFISF